MSNKKKVEQTAQTAQTMTDATGDVLSQADLTADILGSMADLTPKDYLQWLEGGETVYEGNDGEVWGAKDGAIMGEITDIKYITTKYGMHLYPVLRVSNAAAAKFDKKPGETFSLAIVPPNYKIMEAVSKACVDPAALMYNVKVCTNMAKLKKEPTAEELKPIELKPDYYLFVCPKLERGEPVYKPTSNGNKVLQAAVHLQYRPRGGKAGTVETTGDKESEKEKNASTEASAK